MAACAPANGDGDGDGGRGRVNVLAIETATDACSCALECSGAIVVRHVVEPRRHTELLLPMIDAVLAEAGIGLRALSMRSRSAAGRARSRG